MKLRHLVSVISTALVACACGDGSSLGKTRTNVDNTPDGGPASGGVSGAGGTYGVDGAGGTGGTGGTGMECTGRDCPCDPDAEWWRHYVSRSPGQCTVLFFSCDLPARPFFNACGCGCEQSGNTPDGATGSGGSGGNTPDGGPIGSGGSGAAPDGAPTGIPCWVDGVTYEHGATLKDPFSCNTATCNNGYVLPLTRIECPEPCPPGFIGTTRCGACGVVGGCGRYETGCFPSCSGGDRCETGGMSCVDGVCQAYRCF